MSPVRSTLRHETSFPIEVWVGDESHAEAALLYDVSVGGLSFRSAVPLITGTVVRLRVSLVKRALETAVRVVQCHRAGDDFIVGAVFTETDGGFRARMVSQICHIERYKREAWEKEGRALSGHDAAVEWIAKYARDFPLIDKGGKG